MEVPAEQIPSWFYVIIAVGSIGILGFIAKYLLDRFIKNYDSDWSEVKKNMNELINVSKLHEHRLTEAERDIINLQIVKYNRRNGN